MGALERERERTGGRFEVLLKLEKLAFVLPVTTRTDEERQGLNLYGRFFQAAGDLRRWQVMCPKTRLNIPSQTDLFIRRRKNR